MSRKVYVVTEMFYAEGKEKGFVDNTIMGVYGNLESAEKAVADALDDIHERITGGDENEESRISYENPWDGRCASIGDDNCAEWEYYIDCMEVKGE
jgi:hypothetical protein